MNLFEIAGRIIKEPVIVDLSNGGKMCKLELALDKAKPSDSDLEYETIGVTLFRDQATKDYEVGDYLVVDGRLSSFKNEKEGNTYYNITLNGNHVLHIKPKQ